MRSANAVLESNQRRSCLLLHTLLGGNPPDLESFFTTRPSSSEETNANFELHIRTHFSDERLYESRQMPSSEQSTGKVLPVREMVRPTDDQIEDFIAQKVACFRPVFLIGDVERQSPNCAVTGQCAAAREGHGQAHEEDSLKSSKTNAEFTPKSKETYCATSVSKKCSTDPQTLGKVAATCTKNEDESAVFVSAVSGLTLDERNEKHPSSSLKCSSSQEAYHSLRLNINKDLDNVVQMPGVCWGFKHTTERKMRDTGLKSVEAVGVTNVSEDPQTKPSSLVSENKPFGLTTLIENQDGNTKITIDIEHQHCSVTCQEVITRNVQLRCQTDRKGVREDVCPVHSKTNVSNTLTENKAKEQAPLCKSEGEEALSVNILKDPQYEEISDDEDMSQLSTKPLNTEHEEWRFPAYLMELQCEDISEDEKPEIENVGVERASLSQVPEPNDKQFPCEDEVYGHVQSQSQMNTKNETDDQMDDDWIVIPISMSDLKFEPEDQDQDSPEVIVIDDDDETGDKEIQCDTVPVIVSAFSLMDVFDTVESFQQAKAAQFKNRFEVESGLSTPQQELAPEGVPCTPQDRRESHSEPEDSDETEDSCDYSSGSEHNYLTVSKQLLKKRSLPLPPETDDSVCEEDGGDDEVPKVQKGHSRSADKLGCVEKLRQLIEAKAASDHVKHKTKRQEGESDQNCKKVIRKRSFSSVSTDPVIPPLVVVESSQPTEHLKLLKDSRVHLQANDESQTPKTLTGTSKNTDSCEKNTQHLNRNKKGKFMSKPESVNSRHLLTKDKVQANVIKPIPVSRQLSLPSQDGPSTSISSLFSTSGQLPEARQSLVSSRGLSQSGETSNPCNPPKSTLGTSIPRRNLSSSKLVPSRSYSSTSTLEYPSAVQSSAKYQVTEDWKNGFFPTRIDKKNNLEREGKLRTTNYDLQREAQPGPRCHDRAPKKRRHSHGPTTPLMKKTKSAAIQRTKDIKQNNPTKQRSFVGVGYKWSEKPRRGSGRWGKCRTPPGIHL